jgi:uncharacterized protein (DUF2141 family)
MKRLLILLSSIALSTTAVAQQNGADPGNPSACGRIRIRIDNLRNTSGLLGIALFTSAKGFPDKPHRAFTATSMPASDPRCEEVVFENIPYGIYAVSVLHDENGNRTMDKTFIGVPKEGFGTSNNPKIRYGPPDFGDAQFTLDCGEVALKIGMNYF